MIHSDAPRPHHWYKYSEIRVAFDTSLLMFDVVEGKDDDDPITQGNVPHLTPTVAC